ncbi:hypothetical protein LguiA_022229 [Lonicera macranthoides]
MGTKLCWTFCYFIHILCISSLIRAQPFDYPTANLSSSWLNNVSAPHSINFIDRSRITAILLRGTSGPRFACGFFCNGNCTSYLFAIYIVQTNGGGGIVKQSIGFPQVVWSANRNKPVGSNAMLQLSLDGDLVLRDADGTLVWSTNTANKNVAGLNLTDEGNLVLFDENNSTVWQSFDYPTDALVPGQKLVVGKRLTASISATNSAQPEQGWFSLFPTNEGLLASIESNSPQVYAQYLVIGRKANAGLSYVRFLNGSLAFFINSVEPGEQDRMISIPQASSAQYMKLEPDGHLKVYEWGFQWKLVVDLLTGYLGECNYPMVCGKNGICSNGQCSCPRSFRQISDRQPNLGCSEIVPLTCNSSQDHTFIELEDVTYFTFNSDLNLSRVDMESCKQECLRNCSCKAAIFRYGSDPLGGECYMPSEIFSLMNNEKENTYYNSSAFVKVQIPPSAISPTSAPTSSPTAKKKNWFGTILGSTFGGFFVLLIIGFVVFMKRRKGDGEEDYLDQVPGLPARFSYEDLKVATENFNKKLGEGGFGSVFEGTLKDGTKVAVKCLDGLTQVKKSFIAEVETIGSIHHVNLVRLIGFCVEKSHGWILVYEYMCNGSLDRWIYHQNKEGAILDWKCRKKVVLDIAKGLSYLHEDCRQKIIHLDIKPQNILLDENYNAKVADFGLSKLVDRNQSQVMTTMRGTPGYLAPEWLNSIITEKVDVYSFGVVVLEICCGRKNFDQSKSEESMHLLSLFRKRTEEGKLLEMVDSYSEDMRSNGAEVVEMMKVAAWCLQNDYVMRPSMSVVVKVLEGVMEVEQILDCGFENPLQKRDALCKSSTPLLPSVLSGPR